MTTYTALSNRIRTATTREELARVGDQLDRLYHKGELTARAFSQLDGFYMDRVFILDTLTENSTITAP